MYLGASHYGTLPPAVDARLFVPKPAEPDRYRKVPAPNQDWW
jgi:hypothetical protein